MEQRKGETKKLVFWRAPTFPGQGEISVDKPTYQD
jgi:hypothetical protein